MNVSPKNPFQIAYSLFEHQYLGYLFESFVIEVNVDGSLSLRYQNISSKNADEFSSGLDAVDFELIKLMDSMQQDVVINKFYNKKLAPSQYSQFFFSVYDSEKGNKPLQEAIDDYLETRRAKILSKLHGKNVYVMANDGNPASEPITVHKEKGTILFHFRRNEDNTHYFPTIKFAGEKLDFQYQGGIIVCNRPAWLMVNGGLYSFEKEPDGKKLKPFLQKKFIAIPKKMEETYYSKFVTALIASFDVYAKGFEIKNLRQIPQPILSFSDISMGQQQELFENAKEKNEQLNGMLFKLTFAYEKYELNGESNAESTVKLEKNGDAYTFFKVCRDAQFELGTLDTLSNLGLSLKSGKAVVEKGEAFSWINKHQETLEAQGIKLRQANSGGKRYFVGESSIKISIEENKDWFDIHAIVKFGDFEIPFIQLRKLILNDRREFTLPNGEIAVIPNAWFTQYSDLFHFIDENGDQHILKKHHIALVRELESGNLAKVMIDRKLEKLRDFDKIEDYSMPETFEGTLRPYQKAGYNWLRFLNRYNFGGCLADDMGLGKTVQTLALLLEQKEQNPDTVTSLLIMPTSLLYNWQMEAKKFTPSLKVFPYIGTNRNKKIDFFKHYDLIITSYGIARIDIDILEQFYFNYVILDESQVIKNPTSNIAQSVRRLKSSKRLILTGTPLENNTMDLWSQINFINPGLLGTQAFFKREFQVPIEKKNDIDRSNRLHTIIKPFILRRHKSHVATELPAKVENIKYCEMTQEQEEKYEEVKSFYRNKILKHIEGNGVSKSQFMLLQGLTMLRQIANHPRMVDDQYEAKSGKLKDVSHMIDTAIDEGHKILIFSQFVKHLTLVKKQLDEKKVNYAYLDGSVKNRQAEVDLFQNDDNVKIFLISLKAGGVGLNLTAADYVFILDPWWNPAIEAQAVDRAHRIGQDKTVFTYKFITRNTVEEKILALQQNKLKLASNLIVTEESFVKALSKEDIENLLA